MLAWVAPALFAAARLYWPPPAQNTHTLMYPLVERARAYNTLEPFHPLQPLLIGFLRRVWELVDAPGPALQLLLAATLLAACAQLVLVHRLVRRLGGSEQAALGASLIAAACVNLWCWSLQTASYPFAGAFLLGAALVLAGGEKLGRGDAARAGLLIGLATGFDVACAVFVLPAAVELVRRRRAGLSKAGAVEPLFLAALPALLGELALAARARGAISFEPTFRGFMGSLPPDIVPVWKSLSLSAQLLELFGSGAPADWPVLAPLVLFWLCREPARKAGPVGASLWRLGVGLYAAITAFYLACDPHNRFIHAGTLLLPPLLGLALSRLQRPAAWGASCAGLLVLRSLALPPDYRPSSNPGLDEARFLASRLDEGDVILAAGEPDWILSYGLDRRVPIRVLSGGLPMGDAARRGFGHARGWDAGIADALERRLCGGRRAVLAADALFRPARFTDGDAREAWENVSRRFELQPAWVSPGGQHYHPLAPKPGRCARLAGKRGN